MAKNPSLPIYSRSPRSLGTSSARPSSLTVPPLGRNATGPWAHRPMRAVRPRPHASAHDLGRRLSEPPLPAPKHPLAEPRPKERALEPLVITIAHGLGKDEALRRIRPALASASRHFPVLQVEEEIWSGDSMTFRVRALGQSASGSVAVAADHVRLAVTLPWLLHAFAQVIQKTITHRGRALLEKK